VQVHQALPFLLQAEEQLAPGARVRERDEPEVLEDELQDQRADPVAGEAGEAHAPVGVEALDGLGEADVALLHQVHDLRPGAAVLQRHLDHEPQVARDEFAPGLDVTVDVERLGETLLLLASEQGVAADLREVTRETRRPG
jgi:hypothetical protein